MRVLRVRHDAIRPHRSAGTLAQLDNRSAVARADLDSFATGDRDGRVMWFEVRDGLIARRTDLWDSLTFLRQTGQAD